MADRRPGTQRLIAHFEVATGLGPAPAIGAPRPAADFAAPIARIGAPAPAATRVFRGDQLNAHQGFGLVRSGAALCDLPGAPGGAGKAGRLPSRAPRAAFLAAPSPRIRFVYTPRHASWLNRVESWLSIPVRRRLLKRGRFAATADRPQRLLAFSACFNRPRARPFQWPATGRPLTV